MILNSEESSPVKVLGISWDTGLDMLTFSLKGAILRGQQAGEMTKSRLLGASASLFDLIGLLAACCFEIVVSVGVHIRYSVDRCLRCGR